MKLFVVVAIIVWLLCGVAAAWLLGQQRVDIPTIAAGPVSLVRAFEKPVTD